MTQLAYRLFLKTLMTTSDKINIAFLHDIITFGQ